ncbi:MAG: ADP-ribosylglycohydrolase family protein [Bacillota bacterium]
MNISTFDRVLGSLYGMATGDALGVPSSFKTPQYIAQTWGWIDRFYPAEEDHIFHAGLKAGECTDDSEQALALMNSFLRNRKVVQRDIVDEIVKWAERVKDKYASPLGPSTERALKAIQQGADLELSGRYANTNGSAMRISPLGIIHGLRGSSMEELVRDVYYTSMPTHNTTVTISAAAAIAWGVAVCIRGERDIEHIVQETVNAADLGKQYGIPIVSPSIGKRILFACELVKKFSDYREAMAALYEYFGGGDLAADSIPVAVALFVLAEGNPQKANEYAVNLGGDCDTNAAMAGAMAGAYAGVQALPEEWCETIESVNHLGLPDYARKLIDLAPLWETTSG